MRIETPPGVQGRQSGTVVGQSAILNFLEDTLVLNLTTGALDVTSAAGGGWPPPGVFPLVSYGADPTGVADSTVAIQAAITAALAWAASIPSPPISPQPAPMVLATPGVYTVSSELKVPLNGFALVFLGWPGVASAGDTASQAQFVAASGAPSFSLFHITQTGWFTMAGIADYASGNPISLDGNAAVNVLSCDLIGGVASTAAVTNGVGVQMYDSVIYGGFDFSASGYFFLAISRCAVNQNAVCGNAGVGSGLSLQIADCDMHSAASLDISGAIGGWVRNTDCPGTFLLENTGAGRAGCQNMLIQGNYQGPSSGAPGTGCVIRDNHAVYTSDLSTAPWTGGPTTPAVPATTVALTNSTGLDCQVFLTANVGGDCDVNLGTSGATITVTAGTTISFWLPAQYVVTLTYTDAPTWVWIAN